MARIISYSDFLGANEKHHTLNSLNYNSEREGVVFNSIDATDNEFIKLDISYDNRPSTLKQKNLIDEYLKLDPNFVKDFYFEDYKQNESMYQASKLISHLEQIINENQLTNQIYLDYMSTRPRVELNDPSLLDDKTNRHGLFDNTGAADKEAIKEEIANHKSYVWRDIVSLRRSDAIEFGYDNQESWKNLLIANMPSLAQNLGIPTENFRWCAAFHDEGHHPHVHVMYYDVTGKNGFRDVDCIEKFKSSLANQIFDNEMYLHKELKNIFRSEVEDKFGNKLNKILSEKTNRAIHNLSEPIKERLEILSDDMTNKGKKVYAFQSPEIKLQVDSIVELFLTDEDLHPLIVQYMKEKKALSEFYKLNTDSYIKEEMLKMIHPQKGDRKVLHNLIVKAAATFKEINLQERFINGKNFGQLMVKINDDNRVCNFDDITDPNHALSAIIKVSNAIGMSPSDILNTTESFRLNQSNEFSDEKVLETILEVREKSIDQSDINILNKLYGEKVTQPSDDFNNHKVHAVAKLILNMINFISSDTMENQRELSRLNRVRRIDQNQIKHAKSK